jgi:transcriptional regulator with PAS, ATPase and Fis domain
MEFPDWVSQFPGSVTVCDPQGIILYMNDKSAQTFAADGGRALIGSDVLDCHPPTARRQLESMLGNQQKNIYTIEKNGVKKLVYQTPWYQEGTYAGFVEMILELPSEIPHFMRG